MSEEQTPFTHTCPFHGPYIDLKCQHCRPWLHISPDAGTGTPETDEALKQTSVLVNYAPSFIAFARSLESRLAAALADNTALRLDKERLDELETQDCWIGLKGHSDARPIHAAGGGYTQKVREVADKLRAARAAKSEGGE